MARVRMTADRKRLYEIIEEFFVTGQLEAMIAPFQLHKCRQTDGYVKEEFKQELCEILLTYKKPKKLIAAYEKGQLGYFILVIIRNQLKSVTSAFYRSHNRWQLQRQMLDFKKIEQIPDED